MSPTAQIVNAARATQTLQDAQGRELVVFSLTALDRLRLFKAVGPILSQNSPYLGMATLACSVSAIDGVPVPPPVTEAQIEALVAKLGDVGIAAVAGVLSNAVQPELGSAASGN